MLRRIGIAALAALLSISAASAQSSAGGNAGGGGGAANPYPGSDYATSARQDAQTAALGAVGDAAYSGSGNAGNVALGKGQYAILSNLYAAIGAAGDTASTATGANGSQVALLKALRDRLAGTLTVSGTVSVGNFPATQAVSAASLPLPSGAATAANQSTQITAEQTIATASPRSVIYSELTASTAIPANASFNGATRTTGTACSSWVAAAQTDVAATLYIYSSDNSFTTRGFTMASVAMTANTMATLKVPAVFPQYKAIVTAGGTAGTVGVLSFACVAN